MRVRIAVELTEGELEILNRPVRGSGGFQGLLRRLQRNVVERTLILEVQDIERILRYATDYGEGGFQSRLRAALVGGIRAIVEVATPYLNP
jgi:hypothetical protein